MNQAWSETGDRYILKLFRDFIFHSIGFEGEPIVDMAHIVQCLNKVRASCPRHLPLSLSRRV